MIRKNGAGRAACLLVAGVCLTTVVGAGEAVIRTVCPRGCDFVSLETAVAAFRDGDTIQMGTKLFSHVTRAHESPGNGTSPADVGVAVRVGELAFVPVLPGEGAVGAPERFW